jgi:hypothetical protein
VKLLMQGMRRSGTTIIYDALCQDTELKTWYEPLAAAKKSTLGGGSGVQAKDLFEPLRVVREEFAGLNDIEDHDVFNYGAPKDAELEFSGTLSPLAFEYLSFLLGKSNSFMAKFTRMYCKVAVLKSLCPDGVFVHLVRDPRAVTSSYLFGKGQRNKSKFLNSDVYFERRSNCSAWSSRPFSDLVLSQAGWEKFSDPYDFERILLIWKYTFEHTRRSGIEAFGDKYMLLRHEDLCSDPVNQLMRIYKLANKELPDTVRTWVLEHVNPVKAPFEKEDVRWERAFDRLEMNVALAESGY